MCGICGHTDDATGAVTRAMAAELRHRGPDDEGVYVDPGEGVAIGVRRLSIIDVPGGHQPLCNEDESVWIAFNGEIYNFQKLRERLEGDGHVFRTRTDTEVLVHLYERYGDGMVHALDGMFAFALWDARRKRLLLARDHFGEKPLFWHDDGRRIAFASELKALQRSTGVPHEPDPRALDAYFVLGYVPAPRTIIEGVRQLEPGSLLVWEAATRRTEVRRYWTPPEPATESHDPFPELVAETMRLLETSTRERLVADVPIGVFLSGGVDSTLVALLAAKAAGASIRTFTVGYDDASVSEAGVARRTARLIGSEHHELRLGGGRVAELLGTLAATLDQPIADQALLPLHAVARFARDHVKVAVGGEGADELFGGYPRYRWLARAEVLGRVLPDAPRRAMAGVAERLPLTPRGTHVVDLLTPGPTLVRHLEWVTAGRWHERSRLYGPRLTCVARDADLPPHLHPLLPDAARDLHPNELLRFDQLQWLPDDVLAKSDRAGMLASLEIRTPFLQREIAEFAASVPAAVHARNNGKALLRAALSELAPRRVNARRRKEAFRVPAADWLRGPLSHLLRQQLAEGRLFEEGWFDRGRVRAVVEEHDRGRDASGTLWPVLVLGLWLDAHRGAA